MKKRILTILLSLWVVGIALPVWAAEAPGGAVSPGQYVYDFADLLEEEEQQEQRIAALREEFQIDIVLVTTDNAEGLSAQDYADDFYDYNDFGYNKPRGDGVLFLIDMDNREAYISTCGKVISYFTDSRIDRALDDIVEELQEQDYDGACEVFLDRTENYMNNLPASSVSNSSNQSSYKSPEQEVHSPRPDFQFKNHWKGLLLFSVIAAGIIVMVMVQSSKAGRVAASAYLNPENGFQLTGRQDQFLNQHTTSRKIPKNEDNGRSGGGGRSSVHTSHSGTSHGGGGRSF